MKSKTGRGLRGMGQESGRGAGPVHFPAPVKFPPSLPDIPAAPKLGVASIVVTFGSQRQDFSHHHSAFSRLLSHCQHSFSTHVIDSLCLVLRVTPTMSSTSPPPFHATPHSVMHSANLSTALLAPAAPPASTPPLLLHLINLTVHGLHFSAPPFSRPSGT